MGLRSRILKGFRQSQSIQIEYAADFDPKKNFATPGMQLHGDVVIRSPQPLSINELCVTVYGITDTMILRNIGTTKNYFHSCGFLFQEIMTLLRGPVTLEPSDIGHKFPFSFTLSEATQPMAENDANLINKFKPRRPFRGAQEIHPLPPSFGCSKKLMSFGYHESSEVYHLDVTCTKGPNGESFWLPQTASTFSFSPVRSEANPDPAYVSVLASHNVVWQVPSVVIAGSILPLQMNCNTSSPADPVSLTALHVCFTGHSVTRARSFLLGEMVAEDKTEREIVNLQNLSIALGPATLALQDAGVTLQIPMGLGPCFTSFNICQEAYDIAIRYELSVGGQKVMDQVSLGGVTVLPSVYQAVGLA